MPLAAVNTGKLAGKEAEQIQMIVGILNSKSHYEVLGVAHDADEASIKSVYKKMVVKVHPDKISSEFDERDKTKAQQAFRAVQNAYEVLTVPHQRKSYDLQLKMQAREGKTFVPGEDGATKADETPSAGQFFVMVLQIVVAMILHVLSSIYLDGKAFFTAQAIPLHCTIVSFIVLWWAVGYGFFSTLLWCLGLYGIYRIVPHQQAKEALQQGIAMQTKYWKKKEGQPLHIGLAVIVFTYFYHGYSVAGAFFSGFSVFGTLMLVFLMPQLTFHKYADPFFCLLELILVLYAPVDVHVAVFLGLTSWHLMQEIPGACIASILICTVYLTYRFSPALVLVALSIAVVAIGEHTDIVVGIGLVGMIISWYNYGWVNLMYTFCLVYGLRRGMLGQEKGKRLAFTSVIVWCLGLGWMLTILIGVIIFGVGEFLLFSHKEELKKEEEERRAGGHGHASGRSPSKEDEHAKAAAGGKKGKHGKK
mmetsp:Transcript_11172/g.22111  ORF Transcript_11172/g.22111 Transcript_11172/m.22111 type:complete len:476 (-) Transcript_11172:81-1508(-)|eukprot:CAMPEP_0173407320 /NCGR_PEP_ID=MMETSP1356-20130122/66821_1 /TAXON_ID=77927 ORGANISM="Hemiselmis virescens, Strain PCC157" /NCGR_SAMPLE_ID=MMETSP1356 /ASSEMBLY_ACC=CAM_ASM_000847 /LENGTH=475 /DNA_ID=CAMNT_0014368479 /DNA_START=236 /DNA_END=1663 /DNA_ORIENTATION=-